MSIILSPAATADLSVKGPLCCLLLQPLHLLVLRHDYCGVQIAFTYRIITLFQSGQMSVIVSLSRRFIKCVPRPLPHRHTPATCATLFGTFASISYHLFYGHCERAATDSFPSHLHLTMLFRATTDILTSRRRCTQLIIDNFPRS